MMNKSRKNTMKISAAILFLAISALSACGNNPPTRGIGDDAPYEVAAPTPIPASTPIPTPRRDAQRASASAYTDRAIELSDFGRQAAKDFLQQFDSLFVPSARGEAPNLENDAMSDFVSHWHTYIFERDDVDHIPFIGGPGGGGNLIATHFWIYDLNYNGIPDIVIAYAFSTRMVTTLYSFADGQYVAISSETSTRRFFYDQDGRLFSFSGCGPRLVNNDGDITLVEYADFWLDWSISWEEQGLTEILPLTDLANDIHQSITKQFFTNETPRRDAQCASASAYTNRTIEISDFGRQAAEDFLEQFESLFILPLMFDGRYADMPQINWWYGDVWLDRYGNELTDEVPFIRGTGMNRFIASNFWLYDLTYNGIPNIVISFTQGTWGRSSLFSFVDGQYREVSTLVSGHQFFYDQDGNMIMTDEGSFRYIYFDGVIMHVGDAIYPQPTWSLSWEEQGLARIPSLTDLEKTIREAVKERLFADCEWWEHL